jgi:hypothetical protein
MSISALSTSSVTASYTPPPVQQQQAAAPQAAAHKADTVTISKQAQVLAKDGDTAAQEAAESGAEKASEAVRGKA